MKEISKILIELSESIKKYPKASKAVGITIRTVDKDSKFCAVKLEVEIEKILYKLSCTRIEHSSGRIENNNAHVYKFTDKGHILIYQDDSINSDSYTEIFDNLLEIIS